MRTPIARDVAPCSPRTSSPRPRTAVLDFLALVNWLDRTPILSKIEPYRQQILSDVLDTRTDDT